MKVEIKRINQIRLAAIEYQDSSKSNKVGISKLASWAKTKSTFLKPKSERAIAVIYNDPKTTKTSQFHVALGIKIPRNLKLEDGMVEKYLPSGRYAVTMHRGSRSNISETIDFLYHEWLPNSGEKLSNLHYIFCYFNIGYDCATTETLTECWLLLK